MRFSELVKSFLDEATWLPPLFKEFAWISVLGVVINRGAYIDQSIVPIYPNVYVLFVGESGTGKGTVIDGFIRQVIEEVNYRLFLGDIITPERLLKEVADTPQGVIAVDEATNILSNKDYMENMSHYLTALYNSHREYVKIGRVKKSYIIKRPYLNIILGVQPKMLKYIMNMRSIASGFLQRFFIVYESPQSPISVKKDMSKYDAIVEMAKDVYQIFEEREVAMRFSDEAYKEMMRYLGSIEQIGVFGRWNDLLSKLALIYHIDMLTEDSDRDIQEIGIDAMKEAIRMMERLEAKVEYVASQLSMTKDDEIIMHLEEVIRELAKKRPIVIDGKTYIARRDLLRYSHMRLSRLKEYMVTLRELEIIGREVKIEKKVLLELTSSPR